MGCNSLHWQAHIPNETIKVAEAAWTNHQYSVFGMLCE